MIVRAETLEYALVQCLSNTPPDFDMARQFLAQGANINAVDDHDDETLLHRCIMDVYFGIESKFLPEMVRFFLENGYDVTRENGRFGAEVLYALCWSTYDKMILDAAKILLDAGADPLYPVADGEDVLATINWKRSGCIPVDDDLELECLFTVLYDIVETKTLNKPYSGIQWWDEAVGKRIDRVYSCAPSGEEALFEFVTGSHQYRDCCKEDIVLLCEGIPLRLTNYCHAYVNPYGIPDNTVDLSDRHHSLIGKRIQTLRFSTNLVEQNRMRSHGSVLEVVIEDGTILAIRDNADQFSEKYCARMEII